MVHSVTRWLNKIGCSTRRRLTDNARPIVSVTAGCSLTTGDVVVPPAEDVIVRISTSIVRDCLGVRPDETLLIITDTVRRDIGRPLFETALALGVKATYVETRPGRIHGEEPPAAVAKAMLGADAMVAVTQVSITHTRAKKDAMDNGGRIVTMPLGSGSSEYVMDVFSHGGMAVDLAKMSANIDRLATRLRGTRQARITTGLGTDLLVDYAGRAFRKDNGFARMPGEFTNLPAGELYVAAANANGTAVVDATVGNLGRPRSPLKLTFRDGMVVSIAGEQAGDLEAIIGPLGEKARRIGEFAIGMNPRARLCGIMVEDEKIGGTVHFALGNNVDFGGDNDAAAHLDCVMTRPTVYVDGEQLDLQDYL